MHDVARFRPEDPAELVEASFACPHCLHEPSVVRIDAESAQCACLPCGIGWEVGLDDMQRLRLALSPPPRLARPPMWGVGSG